MTTSKDYEVDNALHDDVVRSKEDRPKTVSELTAENARLWEEIRKLRLRLERMPR